jgi:hypothetical protein
MPDLDDLLSSEIATVAADAARRPTVASLAARGARRRRTRHGSVLLGVAATVGVIVVGVTQLRGPAVTTPGRAPSTATTDQSSLPPSTKGSSPGPASAAEIVGSADSRIWSLSVAPGNAGHRLSEWYTCLDGPSTCELHRYALAVTADSFGSRHVVDLPAVSDYPYDVEVAGAGHFIVSHNSRLVGVVDLSGRMRKITVGGPAGPATRREVVSTQGTKSPIAVDPRTGAAHRLALPSGTQRLESVSGRLWASGTSRLAWSDDGGAHWTPVVVPASLARKPIIPIASADQRTVGLIVGGNQTNDTLPWLHTLRGVAGAALTSYPPAASTVDPRVVAILPDGRLLALIPSWKSWQSGQHSPAAGLYVGQDWSHLAPVRMGPPFAHLSYTSVPPVLSVTVVGGTATIYATSPNGAEVLSSTNLGATWAPEAAR